MASSDYDNMLSTVRTRLPGAIDGVITLELQSLMQGFCDETNVLIDEVPITLVVGQTDYPVESDYGVINRLLNVVNGDNRPIVAELLTPPNGDDDYVVRLASAPNTSDTCTANIAIVPDGSVTIDQALPDWMWSRYRVGITDGVLYRLMSQQAKPYTNTQLAQAHYTLYRRAVGQAKREVNHRYLFRGQGWGFPQSFATRRR